MLISPWWYANTCVPMCKYECAHRLKPQFLNFFIYCLKYDILRHPYVQKILHLFHVVVCLIFVNDTGGRRLEKKITNYRMGRGEEGLKKYHFKSDILFSCPPTRIRINALWFVIHESNFNFMIKYCSRN